MTEVLPRDPARTEYVKAVQDLQKKDDAAYDAYMKEHPNEGEMVQEFSEAVAASKPTVSTPDPKEPEKPHQDEPKKLKDNDKICPELLAMFKEGEILQASNDKYNGDDALAKYALAITYNAFSKKKINLKELSKRCYVSTRKPSKKEGELGELTYGLESMEVRVAQSMADQMIAGLKATISLWRKAHPKPVKAVLNQAKPDGKVVIDVNIEAYTLTQHTNMCIEAITTVFNTPQKKVFVRNGILSNIFYDEKGNVKIADINRDGIRNILDQCCHFVTFEETEHGDLIQKKARPPRDVCENILATTGLHEKMPPLLGITESPYISMDGAVVTAPGYNDDTALYFVPSMDYKEIAIPDAPTPEQVSTALAHIEDLLHDFQFEDTASRENVIAAILTSVLRPTINGCTPLYLVDKPQMGTGGSLICEIINRISTGKALEPSNAPKANDGEEWEKMIVSILAAGAPSVCFDNIESNFQSAALASVLTARSKKCRILGTTNHTTFAVNVNWMGNGINLNVGGDLPRRVYMSRIITDCARPQQRTDFKIPKIKEHVSEHRYEYIADILTIAKAYHNAGCPKPEWVDEMQKPQKVPAMGSFEEWRDYIGGIMVYVGKMNFLGNMEKVLTDSETQNSEGEALLEQINQIYGQDTFTAKMIIEDKSQTGIEQHRFDEFLPGYITMNEASSKPKKLGKFFSRIKGRVFPSGYKLVYKGEERHVQHWSVVFIEQRAQSTLNMDGPAPGKIS